MTMGRDHFVRVVYQGYLFPFGHAASLVKITERKMQDVPNAIDAQRAAYLRTRMFVIVRQPTLDYNYNGFPFRQVTLKTLVTPSIDPPGQSQIADLTQDAFWIRANSTACALPGGGAWITKTGPSSSPRRWRSSRMIRRRVIRRPIS